MKRALWTVIVLLLLYFLGQFIPRMMIHPQVEEVAGGEGPIARCVYEAYVTATTMVGGSLEVFFNTGLRVVNVEPLPQRHCSCPYRVTIRAYTLFGVPYTTFIGTCDSVIRGNLADSTW